MTCTLSKPLEALPSSKVGCEIDIILFGQQNSTQIINLEVCGSLDAAQAAASAAEAPRKCIFFFLNFDYTQRQLHWEVIVVPQEGKCWYIVQLGKSSLSEVHSTHHSNNGHVVCLLVRPWFCFLLERCTQHFSKDVGIWAWCWWPAKTQCPNWRHPEQNRKFQRFEVRYCQVC